VQLLGADLRRLRYRFRVVGCAEMGEVENVARAMLQNSRGIRLFVKRFDAFKISNVEECL